MSLKKYVMVVCVLLLSACDQVEPLGVDQHGVKIAESTVAGQWLVINYWAVWCAPCRKEVPELNALQTQLQGQGVQVFGVNYDDLQGAELLEDSQLLGIEFPVLAHDPAERFDLTRAAGLPATYIIDPQGKVVEELKGEQTQGSIMAVLHAAGWSAP